MARGVIDGGEGGIRTLEGLSPLPVFKTGAINRSATSPRSGIVWQGGRAGNRGGAAWPDPGVDGSRMFAMKCLTFARLNPNLVRAPGG